MATRQSQANIRENKITPEPLRKGRKKKGKIVGTPGDGKKGNGYGANLRFKMGWTPDTPVPITKKKESGTKTQKGTEKGMGPYEAGNPTKTR